MTDQRGRLFIAALGYTGARFSRMIAQSTRSAPGSTPGPGSDASPSGCTQGFDLQLTRYDERGWACDVLHHGHGAFADQRDRHRVGAHAVARDAAGGMGRFEEGGGGRPMIRKALLVRIANRQTSRLRWTGHLLIVVALSCLGCAR